MQKKLKLQPEELNVTSFDPAPKPGAARRGTVAAHVQADYETYDNCTRWTWCLPYC